MVDLQLLSGGVLEPLHTHELSVWWRRSSRLSNSGFNLPGAK